MFQQRVPKDAKNLTELIDCKTDSRVERLFALTFHNSKVEI